jgi:mRNA interferase ChpB
VLVNKIRMLDLAARQARKIERAPVMVIDDALSRIEAMLS